MRRQGLASLTIAISVALAGCVGVTPAGPPVYLASKSCGERMHCFVTIQEAIDAASLDRSPRPVEVRIGPGVFEERIRIVRDGLVLSGAGAQRTRVTYALAAGQVGEQPAPSGGTAGSATAVIAARDVTVRDLTIENGFDYLSNDALPEGSPGKIAGSQAVALLLDGTSDRVLAERVHLLGYQDTLYARGARAVIRDSLIAGNVDFIFGPGALLIEDSELRTRRRGRREGGFESFVLAPSTPAAVGAGILVHRSRLTREAAVADGSVALARPWHPTTTFVDGRYADPDAVGMAVFVDCVMDAHVHPRRWAPMAGTARDGTKTAIFRPEDSRFFETGSRGPGAPREDAPRVWNPPLSFEAMRALVVDGWAGT